VILFKLTHLHYLNSIFRNIVVIVSRNKNGILAIDISARKSPTGKRIRVSAHTKSMFAAKALEKKILKGDINSDEVNTLILNINKKVTLYQLEMEARREHWCWSKNPEAHAVYGDQVIKVLGANKDIRLINMASIRKFILTLRNKGNQNGTINRKLAHLSKLLNLAKDWEYLKTTPRIRMLPEPQGRQLTFSKKTEIDIINGMREHRTTKSPDKWLEAADLITVLCDTGARLNEILSLTPDLVDFYTNHLTFHWRTTKNSNTRRIPMTKRVADILKARECHWTINKNEISYRWRKIVRGMGITDPEMVTHSCRHTCASRLIAGGMDIYEVSKWLGHTSVETTERYAHLFTNQLQKGVGILEDNNAY